MDCHGEGAQSAPAHVYIRVMKLLESSFPSQERCHSAKAVGALRYAVVEPSTIVGSNANILSARMSLVTRSTRRPSPKMAHAAPHQAVPPASRMISLSRRTKHSLRNAFNFTSTRRRLGFHVLQDSLTKLPVASGARGA